jgi:hypothetical protein
MAEMNCIRLQVWRLSVNVIYIAFFSSGAELNADGMHIPEFLSGGNASKWMGTNCEPLRQFSAARLRGSSVCEFMCI